MRPLELALEGFTSFRTPQRLDFTPLDLFAITGPTGAGKSSILDAMTFALYGLTIRTGKQASELVSQGATELKVLLRFSVRNVEYRVTRTWRYRPSAPESKVLLERLDGDDWTTLETRGSAVQKAIEVVVGMDFDTFTRVILLPQGKFDEFLKGDAPKRRELLRQLAGLEIYERMRKEASERSRAHKAAREASERQLDLLEVPGHDETEARRAELTALDAELPVLAERASMAEKALAEEERLYASVARLGKLRGELGVLTAKDVEVEVQAERLARAQKADRLKGEAAALSASHATHRQARTAAETAAVRHVATARSLAEQRTRLDEAQAHAAAKAPELQAREAALATIQAYESARAQAAQDAASADKALAEHTRAHASAEAELRRAEARAQASRQAAEENERRLLALVPGGERLQALSAASRPLSQWMALKKQADGSRRKREEAGKLLAETTERAAKLVELLKQRKGELVEVQSALASAQAANGEAALHDHARLLRAGLNPGDDCLACGGDFDPARAPALAASALIDLKPLQDQAADRLERTHKGALVVAEAEAKRDAARTGELEAQRDLEAAEAELLAVRARIDGLLGATWDAAALETELAALTASDKAHREAADRQKECQAAQREAEQALAFARQTLEAAQLALGGARAEAALRAERLETVLAELHALTGGQAYEALAQALTRDREALDRLLTSAQTAHQAAHDAALQAEEGLKQADEALATAVTGLQRAEEAWASALLLAGFTDGSFADAQARPEEQEAWQAAIEAHAREKLRLGTLVEELATAIGDRQTDAESLQARREGLQTLLQDVEAARAAIATLRAWLTVAESKQKTAADLLAQVASLLAQEQLYHTLSRDLKADEFQDYLLEFLQVDLVMRATVILRELTDDRFVLKMREGEFWVEDNWNGGDARRVRTLSGGETFATSLSMALALSEKLAMGQELGSLFLDEGFGTLDAETLESVTQILESLRAQNRMIGVITHVRSLGERLPTQVKVAKSPDGSRLRVESH